MTEALGDAGPEPDPPEAALRPLHPLTPLLQSWRYVAAALGAAFVFFRDNLEGIRQVADLLRGEASYLVLFELLLALLLLFALATAWAFVVWRMTRYAVVGDTLFLRRGVLMRQRRQLRLDRIQGVDVQQPLLARLAGLAQLRIEMAAGQGATTVLGYLTLPDAGALRARLLSRSPSAAASVADAEVAEQVILRVPAVRVLQARLLEVALGVASVVAYAVVVVLAALLGWLGVGGLFGLLAPVLPVLFGLLVTALRRFVRDANFVLARAGDGLRIRSGLLTLSARTIPARRVQGVHRREPLLWRPFGWAALTVDVAGTGAGGGSDNQPAANTLVPVASRAEATAILRGVVGLDVDALRYVRVPARARWLDPFAARCLGVALAEEVAVSRTGWLQRQVAVVPYARVQSVRVRQGPLQRRLRVASVYLDGPQGAQGWVAPHRAASDARELVQILAARAREFRRWESAGASPSSADSFAGARVLPGAAPQTSQQGTGQAASGGT